MSGVDIIGALLLDNPAVIAKVPAGQIKAGMLPDGVKLPALLVRMVSQVERITLRRLGAVRVTDRVSVMVRTSAYQDQCDIVQLVRDACAGFVGSAAGVLRVSVLNGGTGPEGIGATNDFEQTQDFRVSYDEPIVAMPMVAG